MEPWKYGGDILEGVGTAVVPAVRWLQVISAVI